MKELGIPRAWHGKMLTRYADVATEALIPGVGDGITGKLRRMRHVAIHGNATIATTIAPDVKDEQVPLMQGLGGDA